MCVTPPRPSRKRAAPGSSSSGKEPQEQAVNKNKQATVVFTAHSNWTRYVKIDIKQGEKGYDKDNNHAKAVLEALMALKNRNLIVLQSAKTWPDKLENPMYKWFKGWCNRVDLDTETDKAVPFVKGVHAHLLECCKDDIAACRFALQPEGFEASKSFATLEEFISALEALPAVEEESESESEGKSGGSARARMQRQLDDMGEMLKDLHQSVEQLKAQAAPQKP